MKCLLFHRTDTLTIKGDQDSHEHPDVLPSRETFSMATRSSEAMPSPPSSVADDPSPATSRRQGRYWILTIPHECFTPYLPVGITWIRGQLELGSGGFLHWQLVVGLATKQSLRRLTTIFGSSIHAELTRTEAAEDYVWKDDTSVQGKLFTVNVY